MERDFSRAERKAASKCLSHDDVGMGTNGDMVNMMLLRMFGNPFFDENGNCCLNDERGVKALQWIKDNFDKGYYPLGSENLGLMDCFELYGNGQLAIYFGNNVIIPMIPNPNVDNRFALFPSAEGRGMQVKLEKMQADPPSLFSRWNEDNYAALA